MLEATAIGAKHDKEHAAFVVRTGTEVHSVRPRINQLDVVEPFLAPRRKICHEPAVRSGDRRSQKRRFGTEERAQRAFEIAGGKAVKPEFRNGLIDASQSTPMCR